MFNILINFQQSSDEQPVDQLPSSSLFLKSNESVLLDSPATGPWMIVSATGM